MLQKLAVVFSLTLSVICGACETPTLPGQSLLFVVQGDSQTGVVHSTLPIPVRVRLLASTGKPLTGQTVMFTVPRGGGVAAPASVVTDGAGEAATVWTLGDTAGTQILDAGVSVAESVHFIAHALPAPLAEVHFGAPRARLLGDSVWVTQLIARDQYGNRVPAPAVQTPDFLQTIQQTDSTLSVTASYPGRYRLVVGTDTLVVTILAPPGRFRLVHYRGDTVETLTGQLTLQEWLVAWHTPPPDTSGLFYSLTDALATRSIGGTVTDSARFPSLPHVIYELISWVIDSSAVGAHPLYGMWPNFSFHQVTWPGGVYDSLTWYQVGFGLGVRWTARGLQDALGPQDSVTIR